MPFCTQCGSQVGAGDGFCPQCGSRQEGVPPRSANSKNILEAWDARTWATLSYVPTVGWLAAVYVLAAQRFAEDRAARFHAFQGLYLFVAWLILDWGFGPFLAWQHDNFGIHFGIRGLLKLALIGVGIFMMVKTHRREDYRLPVLGDLAERSVAEQR